MANCTHKMIETKNSSVFIQLVKNVRIYQFKCNDFLKKDILPGNEVFVVNKRFPCIMEKYGNVVTIVPKLLALPNYI